MVSSMCFFSYSERDDGPRWLITFQGFDSSNQLMFQCSQGQLLRVSHESRGKNHGLAIFFCEHATLDVISKCVKGLPLCRLLYCKCKRGSVSNVYSDSPLTSKMIVPWHIFHMFNGDAKMARPAGRPPSLCLRCTWMTESVSSWRSPTKAFET